MEKLQCSVCGGTLVMSDDGEKAVCESCGMSFKKETVKKMIMELSGPVKVEGIQNSDSLADRAETFLRLGEQEKARAAFRQMVDEYPADWRGWWGLTRLLDWEKHFYDSGTGEAVIPLVCRRALDFAPEEKQAEIRACFEERVRTVKPGTDERLRRDEAERESKAAAEAQKQAEQAELAQKQALYQQAVKQAAAREQDAQKRVNDLSHSISYLTDQIKNEKKLFANNKRDGDRRPVTMGNIIALALGGMLTFAAWVEFHPVGTPVVTLLGLGLPLLFIIRRLNRIKGHFDHAGELERKLKQAQQEMPEARKALEEAKAARQAIQDARPD